MNDVELHCSSVNMVSQCSAVWCTLRTASEFVEDTDVLLEPVAMSELVSVFYCREQYDAMSRRHYFV